MRSPPVRYNTVTVIQVTVFLLKGERDMEVYPLRGQVALVTGAGYGKRAEGDAEDHAPNMGTAIAQRLAAMGAAGKRRSENS